MNVDTRAIRVLDVCSGGGMLGVGIHLAIPTARTVCYVEREAFAQSLLVERMAQGILDDAPLWSDLRTFRGRPWRGVVDIVIGGYPCQPFSNAGLKRGKHDPRHLWPVLEGVVADVQPRICFFENVEGHLKLGLDQVVWDLERMGFRVKVGLYSAEEVGASHERVRVFILAVKLADALCIERGIRLPKRKPQQAKTEAKRGSGELANSMRCGTKRPGIPRDVRQEECVQADPLLGTANGGIGEMVDPEEFGLQAGIGMPFRVLKEEPGSSVASCPIFAPARNDFDSWIGAIRSDPLVKPALPRLADGMAKMVDRTDRIRVGGNGVVPLVAAYAFLSLWACLPE